MIVVVILGVVGFYGFGATVHYQTHWSGPVLTYGYVYRVQPISETLRSSMMSVFDNDGFYSIASPTWPLLSLAPACLAMFS